MDITTFLLFVEWEIGQATMRLGRQHPLYDSLLELKG